MKRTRATALALVNWRGVFYERYLLDTNVTALEGSNGAGKTTVLIGCYVVLLPDMTRLKFTTLAEHGATGGDKGLWGRLGEDGRPAYSVLELHLANGERLLAGVHLERRAEPTVELTPFIVTGLGATTRLQDVLLDRGEMDSIPELSQLREHVAREGGRLETYSTAKEYFSALFDLGVTPLRLATDADRTKFNEMLRTSMSGGISRALTTEMRDFLLKEEAGLADTLKRMRANLDACRRTRIEVEESKKLEHEIAGVYESGQQMFATALHATRERADELKRRFEDAVRIACEADTIAQEIDGRFSAAKLEKTEISGQLSEMTTAVVASREMLVRLKRAQVIQRRMADRVDKLAEAKSALDVATESKAGAESARHLARQEHAVSQDALTQAAEGLADFQKGLDELHRRASEHEITVRKLKEAQQSFPGQEIVPEGLEQALTTAEERYEKVSKEQLHLENTLATIGQRRRDFSEVLSALGKIVKDDVMPDMAFARASSTLCDLRELDAQAARRDELQSAVVEANSLAVKQTQARHLARQLSTPTCDLASSARVRAALEAIEAEFDAAEGRLAEQRRQALEASLTVTAIRERQQRHEHALACWREVAARLEPLERERDCDLSSREALQTLRRNLNKERDDTRSQLTLLENSHHKLLAEKAQLEQSGGKFSQSLLKARDVVDGELLANRFEEVDIKSAGTVEALLGPLSEAIVVDDPRTAVDALRQLETRPDSVWLVGGDAILPLDADGRPLGEVAGEDVLVSGSAGWRLTRIPACPILGRRARERRIADLGKEVMQIAEQLDESTTHHRHLMHGLSEVDYFFSQVETIEAGDPTTALNEVIAELEVALSQEKNCLVSSADTQRDVEVIRNRRKSVRDLLPAAWLLDREDYAERVLLLQRDLDRAHGAARQLEQCATERTILEQRIDVLRVCPESDEDIAEMRVRAGRLQTQGEELLKAVFGLRYVNEHRAALHWSDAAAALQQQTALEPALKAQLEQSREQTAKALKRVDDSEQALQTATNTFQDSAAAVQTLEKALSLDRDEWRECNVSNADDETIDNFEKQLSKDVEHEQALRIKESELIGKLGSLEADLRRANDDAENRCRERDEAERIWQPAQDRWSHLETLAATRQVLAAAMTRRVVDQMSGRGSANLRTDARAHAATLKERLSYARDSSQVLEVVGGLLGSQELSGEACLEAWIEVRHWLQRRIPAQIADVAEPLEALERLRSHLDGLKERLTRQETDLRGDSGDVARNVDIHIRRAQRQITHLNHDLGDVRFGSIHGVRIRLERVDRMDQVLEALRSGEAQALLFQPDIPIEVALDELFRRYGGRTTGQRLLDYREYVEPKVEVRRQSSDDWEIANPLRMSTGEAIGIGAALMMVVLTAWERDANLLRPKRSQGTLRMLFLDEANRLSQDNLSVLFDLCQNLDLQLMIAAPEVARAEGNTTYRLVRRINEHGNEEVIVTGRRLAARAQVDVGHN